MAETTNRQWRPRSSTFDETFQYVHKRMVGEITSVKTPWPRVNSYCIDGLETHTALGLFSRPGVGKSLWKEQLCRELPGLNTDKRGRILKFELEMLSKVTNIREISSYLRKSYGYVCSAEEEKISEEELQKAWDYMSAKAHKKTNDLFFPEDIVEVAPTVEELTKIIDNYMEAYKTPAGYATTIIAIDHIRLIKRRGNQSELDMFAELGRLVIEAKNKYPIIFVLLGHLKREINSDERCKQGIYGNYIRDEDVYAGDIMFQTCDVIIGVDRPSLRQITRYGPQYFIIEDANLLAFHFLKVRNGDPGLSFFKALYKEMTIIETDPPERAHLRAKQDRPPEENKKPEQNQLF